MHMQSNEQITRLCKEKGLRMTGQRRVIMTVLSEATDHPDVVELHRRVSSVDTRISIATVYRTVKLLQDQGILERHTFGDGRARYEPAAQEHHDHLINIDTGEVTEFRSDEIERLQEEIARKHGFSIVSHKLEIYVKPLSGENARRPAKS